MKPEIIIDAFSGRKIFDREISSSEFEDMACSLAKLRECDQLKLLPVLMAHILRHQNDGWETNYGDMVIYRLMPQPDGWENLIDEMNELEINTTLEWLNYCEKLPFTMNCPEEIRQAIELFTDRTISGKNISN